MNGRAESDEITARIQGMDDWRGKTLAHLRALIKEADPDVLEEVKWRKPSDPAGLFNAGLGGNTRRAIDLYEGDAVDAAAFKDLIRAAVKRNGGP